MEDHPASNVKTDGGLRIGSSVVRRARASGQRWRLATARLRALPDVVIIGAQRGGTTSMYRWLSAHPDVAWLPRKEVHYFDENYARGQSWYRARYPLRIWRRRNIEASPFLLFHPLAPARGARDLPESTKFIALLRDPVDRAISHYWLMRKEGWETEPLAVALAREPERLALEREWLERGQRSLAHRRFSYVSRGEYAGQLRRWFDAVGRDRLLVVESEQLYHDPVSPAAVLGWLGLRDFDAPYPTYNEAPRPEPTDPAVTASLRAHFAPHNEELFELLGRRLWGQ